MNYYKLLTQKVIIGMLEKYMVDICDIYTNRALKKNPIFNVSMVVDRKFTKTFEELLTQFITVREIPFLH